MHLSQIVGAVLLLVACDPGVYAKVRLTPSAGPTDASPTARAGEPVAAMGQVALRFGLILDSLQSDSVTRNWDGPVEANGHSRLYVRATRTAGGQVTVLVGEMYTDVWSPRGDSLRRAVADTLRYFGALTPLR